MIQVYTGCGKGKTTEAFGLALRGAGAGLKVYIGQFIKGDCYSELNALKKIKSITTKQFGRGCFIKKVPSKKDIELAQAGLEKIKEIISQRKYDIIILDEINNAVELKLFKVNAVTEVIKKMPPKVELILTGRYAHPDILKLADLVSEIKEVKHYFSKGMKARRGIEY